MTEIRVAIAGVGNCASALVQGLEYYRNVSDQQVPGLMHGIFGGYRLGDVRIVAAFDVNELKVGKDLSEAIFAPPNVCAKFCSLPNSGVKVLPAPVMDGVAPHMREVFHATSGGESSISEVSRALEDTRADMLVNFIPVGSGEATRFYSETCLKANCAFVNCIPEFIASSPKWAERFEQAGLPLAGDDIKSQLGATILHRVLAKLFLDRGVKLDETYQLNLGGDTDFLNMTSEDRLKSKRISKTEAVTSLLPYEIPTRIGPSDYVPFLGDAKICYIHLRGHKFAGRRVDLDVKLAVEDSPNSAGVVVEVIRAVKIALDRHIAGPLVSISAYAFKHPPVQVADNEAVKWVEEFIEGKRNR